MAVFEGAKLEPKGADCEDRMSDKKSKPAWADEPTPLVDAEVEDAGNIAL